MKTEEVNGADGPASEGETSGARERSTVQFPYEDLDAALTVARTVHADYGGRCNVDQLAASMRASATSGAFRNKIGAARMFGLVTVTRGGLQITDLGSRAVDPRTAADARATAFLNVELYRKLHDRFRGATLPNEQGLEAAIRSEGVAAKQVMRARQALQRSAEIAGFFAHGRDRLVMPPVGRIEDQNNDTDNGRKANDPGGEPPKRDADEMPPVMQHPLILGLMSELPDPASDSIDQDDLEEWLATFTTNLNFIYRKKVVKKVDDIAQMVGVVRVDKQEAVTPPDV